MTRIIPPQLGHSVSSTHWNSFSLLEMFEGRRIDVSTERTRCLSPWLVPSLDVTSLKSVRLGSRMPEWTLCRLPLSGRETPPCLRSFHEEQGFPRVGPVRPHVSVCCVSASGPRSPDVTEISMWFVSTPIDHVKSTKTGSLRVLYQELVLKLWVWVKRDWVKLTMNKETKD